MGKPKCKRSQPDGLVARHMKYLGTRSSNEAERASVSNSSGLINTNSMLNLLALQNSIRVLVRSMVVEVRFARR